MTRKKSTQSKTLVHITDLHLDHWPQNLDAMLTLIQGVPADLFLVGGDNGGEDGISRTVSELRKRNPSTPIGWVMGNHDLWDHSIDYLWRGFGQVPATYLERVNLELDWCTVVGTYGHYDFSGGDPSIPVEYYEEYFYMGMIWNDHLIHRNGRTNVQIAEEVAGRFKDRYLAALDRCLPIIVLTHTVPFVPMKKLDLTFVSGYSINKRIGEILLTQKTKPVVVFCGHTHRPARSSRFSFPVINTC